MRYEYRGTTHDDILLAPGNISPSFVVPYHSFAHFTGFVGSLSGLREGKYTAGMEKNHPL